MIKRVQLSTNNITPDTTGNVTITGADINVSSVINRTIQQELANKQAVLSSKDASIVISSAAVGDSIQVQIADIEAGNALTLVQGGLYVAPGQTPDIPVVDVTVDGTSVVSEHVAAIDLTGKLNTTDANQTVSSSNKLATMADIASMGTITDVQNGNGNSLVSNAIAKLPLTLASATGIIAISDSDNNITIAADHNSANNVEELTFGQTNNYIMVYGTAGNYNLNSFQGKLTAGNNINISTDNVISTTLNQIYKHIVTVSTSDDTLSFSIIVYSTSQTQLTSRAAVVALIPATMLINGDINTTSGSYSIYWVSDTTLVKTGIAYTDVSTLASLGIESVVGTVTGIVDTVTAI